MRTTERHEEKKQALSGRLRDATGRLSESRARLGEAGGPVALQKDTSNLFRDRARGGNAAPRRRLDVRAFDEVLHIGEGCVDAEGMVSYEALVDECLAHGVMPAVVPQLKTIP